ncbi:hypothetical protein ABL78_7058 [Leptomonas seymouri]|uniref:Transmembrane protein n=1 Tax=Leptomonas seymouri TaxID=5684 RepID=A0A0N1PCL5_LEPSE|nr:hypothetical protein ABL78_7058 [Leptomonas seymouri]|eukprot:KPI83898.1 hypothetical protein ABL78_7058 [Leptomonas seymouri]
MFNRVNALFEAIDKKTEEMAHEAEEKDIARAAQQHEHQQQHLLQRSVLSSATPSPYHASNTPHHSAAEMRNSSNVGSVSGINNSSANAALALRNRSETPTIGSGGRFINISSSPPIGSVSAPLGKSAQLQGVTAAVATLPQPSVLISAADTYASVCPMTLPLPAKLPSFHPSLADGERELSTAADVDWNSEGASQSHHRFASGPAASSTLPLPAFGQDSTGDTAAARNASLAVLEHLQARCASLEEEKTRWQQESSTQKAQCSAARDALRKVEQEAHSSRMAQRDAERALATYKETAQRLLEEAQQEVRRVQEASAGSGSGDGTQNAAKSSSSLSGVQQGEESQARALRQRLELLQAEHTALLSEVDRFQEEAAKAAAELQRVQSAYRQAQMQVDELQLEVQAAQESLDGAVAAHADTKAALRALQAQRERQYGKGGLPSSTPSKKGSGEEGANSADTTQLQSELREARQRQQLLTLQLSNKQTALDSAEREVADLKSRYNELVRQFDDAQVEVAAGFRLPGLPLSEYNLAGVADGHHRFRSVAGPLSASIGENSEAAAAHSESGPQLLSKGRVGSTTNEALKRSPAMVRLTRQYGAAGRVAVSMLSAVDTTALRLGRVLTQSQWVWRVILMGYISLLQLWVVLLVLANLASEEGAYDDAPISAAPPPL